MAGMSYWERIASSRRQERAAHNAYAEWLGRVAWNWYCTWTFNERVGPISALRRIRRWLKEVEKSSVTPIGYVVGLEQSRHHDRPHAHGLVAGVGDLLIKPHWKRWKENEGLGRFVPVKPRGKCVFYCTKYAVKDGELVFSDNIASFLEDTAAQRQLHEGTDDNYTCAS